VCASILSLTLDPDFHEPEEASDKLLKIWDTHTGQIIQTLSGHTEGISDVAWSNDGEFLASASDDKTIRIWSFSLVSLRCMESHCKGNRKFRGQRSRFSEDTRILSFA
jgi:COMPASS component SWD3